MGDGGGDLEHGPGSLALTTNIAYFILGGLYPPICENSCHLEIGYFIFRLRNADLVLDCFVRA